jgi:hypothetical protein
MRFCSTSLLCTTVNSFVGFCTASRATCCEARFHSRVSILTGLVQLVAHELMTADQYEKCVCCSRRSWMCTVLSFMGNLLKLLVPRRNFPFVNQ